MKRVLILVEGQTEQTFVLEVLSLHLRSKDIFVRPTIITTREVDSEKHSKGGYITFQKVERQIKALLLDNNAALVTTMIDFYGPLVKKFPGWETRPHGTCYHQVEHLETAFKQHVNHRRFVPYLALHEFEAMLFVAPEKFSSAYPKIGIEQIDQLTRIRDQFDSPEEINHEKPPSERIKEIIPNFDKVFSGPLISLDIGLPHIRQTCRHFDQWLNQIEALAE